MKTKSKINVAYFSPLDKGEREGVVTLRPTPPRLPSYEGRKSAAFTLIELLIAMGIFAVFITIITGVFTNFIQVQRHAIAQGQLISDMRSAMEAFIKEARTGYGSTYAAEGDAVVFVNQNNDCITFRVIDGQFKRADAGEQDVCSAEDSDSNRFSPITSKATEIIGLEFSIPVDRVITIKLTATSKKDGIPPISIQNSITSRQMEPL